MIERDAVQSEFALERVAAFLFVPWTDDAVGSEHREFMKNASD
jgi:hypothetical protein